MRLLLVVCLLPMAGCLDAHSDHYQLSGAFAADRADGDLGDLVATAAPFSKDVAILESFPEQFVVGTLHEKECGTLRDLLAAKSYLANVGDCTVSATP